MTSQNAFPSHTRKWRAYIVALLIIGIASAIRALVFADLGRGTAYLTYYPAVVLAALYGGLYAGFLATISSAVLCFYWIQMGHMSRVETLAMGAFIISCSMISGIAEAMLRAQAREKQERRKAEAANLAKSTFLARMSHELRTPMNAILGFSEIMRRDPGTSPEQRKNLDIIGRSGGHLLALINDVLDMAKIDAGRMTLEPSAFDLGETVREAIELLRQRAEGKNLQLTFEQDSGLPHFVRADQAKLRQAIINLAGNAIKFTDSGGVILRLGAEPGDKAGRRRLVIEVEDSGMGIPLAEQEQIFDPFVQASTLTQQKGTGLGLSITRKFVKLMGGRISVRSTPGKGSIFRVEVPVDVVDAADVSGPVRAGRIIALAPGQPAYRILVVDDQMENWLLLQRLLQVVGLEVRVAENGVAAVEEFARWRPHFIFMDIRMPVMDGLEASRRIRAQQGGQEVKIVAITASVFREEIDKVKEAGMDDLVRKPYRPEDIYDCLTRYLEVNFIREDDAASAAPVAVLRAEHLADLTAALRDELGAALLTLDASRIAGVIGRIAETNVELGGILSQHAGQFNYAAILQALTACQASTTSREVEP